MTCQMSQRSHPPWHPGNATEEPQRDRGLVWIHAHENPPLKRVRGSGTTEEFLNAAQPAAMTRPEPVARNPESKIDHKPKVSGRGAERLATPSCAGRLSPSLGREPIISTTRRTRGRHKQGSRSPADSSQGIECVGVRLCTRGGRRRHKVPFLSGCRVQGLLPFQASS